MVTFERRLVKLTRGKADVSPPRPLGDDAPLEERAPLVEAAIAAVAP